MRITFTNPDDMQHNMLVLRPGTLETVGALADAMAATPDGAERNYVPPTPDVMWFTPLVDPGKSFTLEFTAPRQAGDYRVTATRIGYRTLLFTTFFFNMDGFFSGIWGSLDYWAGQQDEHRGDQHGAQDVGEQRPGPIHDRKIANHLSGGGAGWPQRELDVEPGYVASEQQNALGVLLVFAVEVGAVEQHREGAHETEVGDDDDEAVSGAEADAATDSAAPAAPAPPR